MPTGPWRLYRQFQSQEIARESPTSSKFLLNGPKGELILLTSLSRGLGVAIASY
jgi:hypothetical protein